MKKSFLFYSLSLVLVFMLHSCGQDQAQSEKQDLNASPEQVMNAIFTAAQTGDVALLTSLLPPIDEQSGEIPCDGDCKALCNPGNESMKDELGPNYISLADFKEYFEKGKINGTPRISGNEAQVDFVFGPNAGRDETMNLQKIDGKWYLASF